MTEHKERTVIVTGAARGIGYAIAEAFIKNGDFVAIGDLNLEQAVESAKNLGSQAKGYEVDVADDESVKRFIDQVITDRGTIDVLVNNAGLQHIDKVEDFPVAKWRQLIDIMLTGPFLLTKYIVPFMKKQQYGRIINISSVHGKMASPFKSAYVSAKHGVVGLTRTVAIETANDGITVNAIMPGAVKTELVMKQLASLAKEDGISENEALHKHILDRQHLKRFVEPSEIAAAAIYLASDGAAAVTGETLSVSGGM
ncbi:3-hydroxybutyrate dehydrogenase [Heyndrickxia acidicola]|uniref:3-hydroxybutyrate dehydrogenase n=1 Tax=Heyndrickxia acidicola TaxID=209389 RepID=A0ABU6MF14_9BACI|nr:3-hydroxybutyrate dehydrogenase [Heyndrickxia acidicola]MED1203028.1 3-hydroxybutyrate dehydrogenase [Heyndrickxia acidicola]